MLLFVTVVVLASVVVAKAYFNALLVLNFLFVFFFDVCGHCRVNTQSGREGNGAVVRFWTFLAGERFFVGDAQCFAPKGKIVTAFNCQMVRLSKKKRIEILKKTIPFKHQPFSCDIKSVTVCCLFVRRCLYFLKILVFSLFHDQRMSAAGIPAGGTEVLSHNSVFSYFPASLRKSRRFYFFFSLNAGFDVLISEHI